MPSLRRPAYLSAGSASRRHRRGNPLRAVLPRSTERCSTVVPNKNWIRGIRPAPMFLEVLELFGRWSCRADLFRGDIRRVVHHVRDIGGSYFVTLIRIHVSSENRREHV